VRVTLVDSYDSFTWNLVQVLATLGASVDVVASDRTSIDELSASEAILLGPGPGRPEDAGVLVPVVRALGGRIPILGVCLGHQAIATALGGSVVRHRPVHGYTSQIRHDGTGLFEGLPSPVEQMRYHSLAAIDLPPDLRACAWSEDGAIQALAHRSWPMWGVQFHPESIGSGVHGTAILASWLRLAVSRPVARA
jgi:anthranilate synthase/aminodeoxychorismate synthase-like glutamine amidotransferase